MLFVVAFCLFELIFSSLFCIFIIFLGFPFGTNGKRVWIQRNYEMSGMGCLMRNSQRINKNCVLEKTSYGEGAVFLGACSEFGAAPL